MQHCLLWSIWAQGDAEKLFCAFIIPSFCSCRSSLSDCPTSGKNLLLIQNASVRALIGISRRFDILLLQLERQEFKLTCKVNRFVPFFAEYIFPYKCYIFRVKVEDTNMFANASNKRWKTWMFRPSVQKRWMYDQFQMKKMNISPSSTTRNSISTQEEERRTRILSH